MLRNCSRSPDFVVTSLPAKRPILSRPVVAHWYTCDARTGLLNSPLKKAAMSLALRKNSPAVALSWFIFVPFENCGSTALNMLRRPVREIGTICVLVNMR